MTREEAIKKIGHIIDCVELGIYCGEDAEVFEALDLAISALCPISREQVERVRGKWIEDKYSFSHCSLCGYEQEEPELITPFCANCGAPMTDKAVDIMLQRWDEVADGS